MKLAKQRAVGVPFEALERCVKVQPCVFNVFVRQFDLLAGDCYGKTILRDVSQIGIPTGGITKLIPSTIVRASRI